MPLDPLHIVSSRVGGSMHYLSGRGTQTSMFQCESVLKFKNLGTTEGIKGWLYM